VKLDVMTRAAQLLAFHQRRPETAKKAEETKKATTSLDSKMPMRKTLPRKPMQRRTNEEDRRSDCAEKEIAASCDGPA
jgi:hypothetical protein